LAELVLDRAESPQRLADRIGGHEPAETLAGGDQDPLARPVERLSHGDPGHRVRTRELALARQQPARPQLAGLDPSAQLVGDRAVTELAHLSYPCPPPSAAQGHGADADR